MPNVDSPLVCNPPVIDRKCRSELSLLSSLLRTEYRFLFFGCFVVLFFGLRKSISFLVESSDPSKDENPFFFSIELSR